MRPRPVRERDDDGRAHPGDVPLVVGLVVEVVDQDGRQGAVAMGLHQSRHPRVGDEGLRFLTQAVTRDRRAARCEPPQVARQLQECR